MYKRVQTQSNSSNHQITCRVKITLIALYKRSASMPTRVLSWAMHLASIRASTPLRPSAVQSEIGQP